MDTPKPNQPKDPSAKGAPNLKMAAAPPAPAAYVRIPPLFRKIDWLTLLIAFGVVWVVYFLTLAPQVTLEDSGELCTGAFYAGIPHPPGYPFWSIYSWLWTSLLRVGNVAWRVEVGESTAAAFACGMVALMVSRGSSMLIEGIEELKGLGKKWEGVICLISGSVAGISLGLGGTMWSESVAINRISLFGVPWMMLVLLCMLRWIYAPSQRRFLFAAMFIFGICTTIHQTLLCAGLGIEACIAMVNPRLGRNFFHWNSFLLLGGVIVKARHMTSALNVDPTLLLIFSAVLIASVVMYGVMAFLTKETLPEFCRDGALAGAFLLLVCSMGMGSSGVILWLLAAGCLVVFVKFAVDTWKLDWGWLVVFLCGLLVGLGFMFYFWEPITGMTNPPMEWGYPRTVQGFWHALSRGQYEQAHPTDLTSWPGWQHFYMQLGILISGIAEEHNWVLLFMALVPFLFILKMQKRERSWIISLSSIYLCVGILLVILMNPQDEKQSVDLHKVFFATSHGLIAILLGYGLALTTAFMATQYQKFRSAGLMLGGLIVLPGLIAFYNGICNTYFWGGAGLPKYDLVITIFLVIVGAFVLMALAAQSWMRVAGPNPSGADPKANFMMFTGAAALCVILAIYLAFFNSRSLDMSQFFGALPRMFSVKLANLPAQAGGLVLAVVVLFLAGLLLSRERAPLALTLALFTLMPVASIMSHWAPSEQRNHWFGYWFGHDMFTPPLTGPDGQLTYDPQVRAQAMKGTNAALVYPEMARDSILFGGTDPGRFCPTYMIFCESFIPHKDQPVQDQNFDRRDVYIITQNALADDTYLDYIRAQYNRSQQIDPPFFQELLRGSNEVHLNYTTNALARLAYKLLDEPLTDIGAKVEARRRAEGVYPREEIYIPSGPDLSHSFAEYMDDVQQRYMHDTDPRFNNEPRQLKPGEQPTPDASGHITVAGQTSVMSINGILTKVIFDRNPSNEFYVEESFPLDWMFPHLTPFGDIMKINRQPLDEIGDDVIRRDHEFWSHYSDRTVGNWITYDTSVKQITDWIDKVYIQHDFSGFIGDRRFMRDESAQKSFSKLRTAVAGIYAWRLGLLVGTPTPAKYLPKSVDQQQKMIKEADFAYRQAFAYCPYSAEVVFRYVQFLATMRRIDDAKLVAITCLRLDPNNEGVASLVQQLMGSPAASAPQQAAPDPGQAQAALAQLEAEVQKNPTNFQAAMELAQAYLKLQQASKSIEVLDQILSNTNVDPTTLNNVVAAFYALQNYPKLETAFRRLVQVQTDVPENWYNLASLESVMGQNQDAINDLRRALQENAKRKAKDPTNKANDLLGRAPSDPNFSRISNSPDFQALFVNPK